MIRLTLFLFCLVVIIRAIPLPIVPEKQFREESDSQCKVTCRNNYKEWNKDICMNHCTDSDYRDSGETKTHCEGRCAEQWPNAFLEEAAQLAKLEYPQSCIDHCEESDSQCKVTCRNNYKEWNKDICMNHCTDSDYRDSGETKTHCEGR